MQVVKLFATVLAVLVLFTAGISANRQPKQWCRSNTAQFANRHAAQIGSMTTDPTNIYWITNVTIMANFVPKQTTYVDVANYIYAQRTIYNAQDCAWYYDQAYERIPGSGVVNMVRVKSTILPPSDNPPNCPVQYKPAWVTKPLFDQQLVAALNSKSQPFSKDMLFSTWLDAQDRDIYDEVIKVLIPNVDRYYSNDFYDDATGLVYWGYILSLADTQGYFPSYFDDAFAALDAGTLVMQPDLAGFPFGVYDYLVPTYVRPGAQAASRSSVDLDAVMYDPRWIPNEYKN